MCACIVPACVPILPPSGVKALAFVRGRGRATEREKFSILEHFLCACVCPYFTSFRGEGSGICKRESDRGILNPFMFYCRNQFNSHSFLIHDKL
jgi:hypothetical protein